MRTLSLNIPLVHVQVGLARHLDEAEALVPRDHSAAQAGGLPPLLVCLSRLVSCRPARLGRGPSRLVCGAAHQHRAVIIARLVALPLRRQVVLVVVVVHGLTDAAMSRVCGARVAGATSGAYFFYSVLYLEPPRDRKQEPRKYRMFNLVGAAMGPSVPRRYRCRGSPNCGGTLQPPARLAGGFAGGKWHHSIVGVQSYLRRRRRRGGSSRTSSSYQISST